jgi:ribosome biogenesis GTPase
VRAEDGTIVEASLRGRLKKSDEGRRADGSLRRDTAQAAQRRGKLAVGDAVLLERDARDASESGAWAIAEILPRRSRLARRSPGGGYGERVVVANVDQVVVVFAAARPEPHPRMLDRFLVVAEANGLDARVVGQQGRAGGRRRLRSPERPVVRAASPTTSAPATRSTRRASPPATGSTRCARCSSGAPRRCRGRAGWGSRR